MITLGELLEGLNITELRGDAQVPVESLCWDSRGAVPGCVFFALPGLKADGAKFAAQAVEKGAVAVVTESEDLFPGVPVAVTNNARQLMALAADRFFDHPSRKLRVFGVTGTNGKTTTSFLLKHLCDHNNMPCGLIGTIRHVIGAEEIAADRTTPESVEIQQMMARMAAAGNRAVAMEVSSHALVQHRVDGVGFDAAVFTNLTQDHLDYHGTMDRYFAAKVKLFELLEKTKPKSGKAVVNTEDRYGRMLVDRMAKRIPVVTYGQGVGCDFRAADIRTTLLGSTFQLYTRQRQHLVRLPLIGLYNVYNALGALAAAVSTGLDLRECVTALANAPQVPGRLERVSSGRRFQVFVDYAHTPDALENVLQALRSLKPSRIITVFGCGGDRDRLKRPLMGRAAEKLSDFCVVTSDNPRTEDPQRILADIVTGMRSTAREVIADRAEAIHRAVSLAQPGDVVLIAGKGHEKYQDFGDHTIAFDDVAVARRALQSLPREEEDGSLNA